MQTNSQFQYINEVNFKIISNWSAGTILHSTLMYKEGIPLVPIGDLISRNREKEIIEDDKSYKQVTIKLYGKGVIQRGDDLVLGKNIGTKNQYRISEGQFIMSKIDARNGAFGIVPKELHNAITTQDFLSYNINEELILPQFFVLITATKQFNDLCQKASSGTTGRQRVDEKAFLGFEIPVPNKSEQEEIIKRYNSKVDVADELSIKANNIEKKSIELFLEKLKLSPLNKVNSKKRFELYQFKEIRRWDVFSADNTIYNELNNSLYPISNLGEIYSFVKRPWNKKNEKKNQFEYIELGGVDSLHGIYETKTIETAKAPSRATQTVQVNDLIIGTTRPYLKRFAIVHSKYNGNVCSSGFAVIEPNDEYSLPFLKMYLESEYGLEQLKNQMSGALYPAITLTKLKGILIPSLSKKEQEEIASTIDAMKQEVIEIRNESLIIKANANEEFASEIFNQSMIKLKTFEIKSPFKNLDSLKLDFEKCNGITVLIGNNGSGKSNLIEALSSVFAGLYDHSFDPIFSYELTYEKDEAPITIKYDHSRSRSKYQYSLSDPDGYLPNQIISVYSGEESRLWNRYYFKFYNDYMKDVISSRKSFNENQKMVFINKYYWNTALLTMLVSDLDVEDILGDKKIERIEFEFKSNNTDNITTYNRRSPNDVTRFAAKIFDETSEIAGNTERRGISLIDFKTKVLYTHTELFKLLSISLLPKEDNWKLINKMELFFEDGFSTEELSEGEKKQVLIKFITQIFSDNNSLLLMDEPDSHIHISSKEKIKNLLYDLEDQVHVQSILTTHSPTLTHCFDNDNVYMLVNREGKVVIEDKTKQEIVYALTSDFWNLQEQNIFNSSQKPISLFVEGKHDKIHIQNAFKVLKGEYPELSFDIFNMNSANNIPPMMLGLRTNEVDYGKLFIGIFDDDDVGRTELSKTQGQFPDPRNQNKKRHQLGFYACKYPKHSGHRSNAFTVENMFESNHFEEAYKEASEQYQFNGKSLDSISDDIKDKAKNILAEKSRDFGIEDFKYFRPLFDLLKAIKQDFETNHQAPDNTAEATTDPVLSNGQELYLFNSARGHFNSETNAFTLLTGSKINKNYTPSTKDTYKQTRDALINSLTHNVDGDEIEILQDYEFDSPSGAAKFVNGGNRNGWTSWKNAEGESLKQKYGDD